MSVRRLMSLLAPPLVLAVVCAVLSGRLITGFSASLDELVDGTGRLIPSSLRSRSLGTVPVIVSSSDPAKAHATADALFAVEPMTFDTGYQKPYETDNAANEHNKYINRKTYN